MEYIAEFFFIFWQRLYIVASQLWCIYQTRTSKIKPWGGRICMWCIKKKSPIEGLTFMNCFIVAGINHQTVSYTDRLFCQATPHFSEWKKTFFVLWSHFWLILVTASLIWCFCDVVVENDSFSEDTGIPSSLSPVHADISHGLSC